MARKSSRSRKTKPKKGLIRRILGWCVKLSLVAIVAIGGYMIYLDGIVQEKFSGKRWTIPAKVYARPLELYVGQKLTQKDFLTELSALGYRQETALTGSGEYVSGKNTVDIYTRGFTFYDGQEPSLPLRVTFSGDFVAGLSQTNGQAYPVARLEPVLLGGIYPAHTEDRILIQLKDAPPLLIETLTTIEDREFYNHFGIAPKSILRAVINNLRSSKLEGASTLTQQLVKNFFLTNERSLKRKANEALMAVLLEIHYDKNEILEAYLNEVYLGQDGQRAIHGFGLASQYYFGQPFNELKLHQVALLVAMVNGPSKFNPRRNPETALERRNWVLDKLAAQNVVSQEVSAQAKQQPLGVSKLGSMVNNNYPAFMDLIKRQLREDYEEKDLTEEGLSIFTSLDPVLQFKAEQSMQETYAQLKGRNGIDKVEAAFVVTNPNTGEVLALLGGRDARYAGFNRALDTNRPIGSLVKPAIYLAALEQADRYTLTSFVQDTNFSVKNADGSLWTPRNYDRKEHGTIYLYQGLARSYNISTARLGLEVGVPQVLDVLKRLGLKRNWPAYPAILLGSGDLAPVEVADVYQTIANGGFNTPLRSIRNVLTAKGEPLNRYSMKVEQRFDAGAIYLTQEAMRRTMTEGTGRSVYNRVSKNTVLAGKTGTSNDSRDSWFAGFGQDLLAVAWMGRDDNASTSLTGATGALQLWSIFMQKAQPLSLNMSVPSNVEFAWIDPISGQGSMEGCAGAVKMPYIKGSAPVAMPCTPDEVDAPGWNRGWTN
ncbi:penicillin-binding protein 1B [Pseudomonas sp. F1_0610]|uniref:penicillin-binding protein 1B n=1 Tax=Pseudomonas sp. F1_0610 TaxID=3114284 RepID=UPI0039C06AD5